MLYDYVIEDDGDATKKFLVDRDPMYRKPATPIEPPTGFRGILEGISSFLSLGSFLDILDTNVTAFSDGLPCNKFVAKNSTGLD